MHSSCFFRNFAREFGGLKAKLDHIPCACATSDCDVDITIIIIIDELTETMVETTFKYNFTVDQTVTHSTRGREDKTNHKVTNETLRRVFLFVCI